MAKHTHIFRRFLFVAGLLLLGFFTAHGVTAQDVTQGYQTQDSLQTGMIVRLKPGDGTQVQALTKDQQLDMLGVVINSGASPVTLSQSNASLQVYVATTGEYPVLVTNQNGAIKPGDFVTISSLSGVGMKADNTQQTVIGKALNGFDGSSNTIGNATLGTGTGKQNVGLGRVDVDVAVAHNPLYAPQKTAGVPEVLTKFAQIVTKQPVSAFRIYLSAGVLLVCLIVAGIILVAGVRTGMTAVGRNPLAKRSIVRSLIQVTLMALIVFVIGLIAVYLLLKV